MTIPVPRPAISLTVNDCQQKCEKARTIPHQCTHICYRRPLSHLSAFGTWSRILPPCRGFTRQTALVNLEVRGGDNAEISWDTIACGEGD